MGLIPVLLGTPIATARTSTHGPPRDKHISEDRNAPGTVAAMPSKGDKKIVATAHETVDALVARSARSAIPVRRTFVQQKNAEGKSVPGPFVRFVSRNDRFALQLYLLLLTCASAPPYDVGHHSAVWARALGVSNPTSTTARTRVSKAWARIAERKLVVRGRRHRIASVTPLCEDGSSDPYTCPRQRS